MAHARTSLSMEKLDPAGMETTFGFRHVEPDQKQDQVDAVFDRVAGRYDMMNDMMSAGLHRVWKDVLVAMLAPPRHRPYHVLDVAGGTGDIAFRIARRAGRQAHISVCDINSSMLEVGKRRAQAMALPVQVEFVAGNAENLPFDDNRFEAYTIAFGMRNVPKIAQALAEAYRALKRGGRFLCLEFSTVNAPFLDRLYDLYSFNVIPWLGGIVAQDWDSYQYLVESIRTFPRQAQFSKLIQDAGFERVTYRNLSGGIVAIHSGWKL